MIDLQAPQSSTNGTQTGSATTHPDIVIVPGDAFNVLEMYVQDASVDLVFTDPPYGAYWLHHWARLGALCASKLRPGGNLLAYAPKLSLGPVSQLLSPFLQPVSILDIGEAPSSQRLGTLNLVSSHRPVLWYARPPVTPLKELTPDFVQSPGAEKQFHIWQQSLGPVLEWIAAFTRPNDLVVDPFVGSGTTAIACLKLGRRFRGCEIDWSVAHTAQLRLELELARLKEGSR